MKASFLVLAAMSVPRKAAAVDFNILDDDFWGDSEDESAIGDPKAPDSVVQHAKCSLLAESNEENSIFLATGLNTEDLDTCFDEDFDDCQEKRDVEVEPEQSEDLKRSEIPESFSDGSNSLIFDDGEFEVVPRKRKFPGPAGILPKTNAYPSFSEIGKAADEAKASRKSELPDELLCTPWNCEDDDPDSPWQLMRQDMDVSVGDHDDLAVYTIAWALKMKREKQLPRGKVPVLSVCIKSVSNKILTLRDKTGEILASVDKSFQDFKACLKTGTTMVLRKVGVYVNAKKEHCLLLTRDNLVHIYSRLDDVGPARKLSVNDMTRRELEALCRELQLGALEDAARNPSPVPRYSLFATSGGSPANTFSRTVCRNSNSSPGPSSNVRGDVAHSPGVSGPTMPRPLQRWGHGAASCPATPQLHGSSTKRPLEAHLRESPTQSKSARNVCKTDGRMAKTGTLSPGLPLAVRNVPVYKSPLSATSSDTTAALGVRGAVSARANAATPILPRLENGVSNFNLTLNSRTVVNPAQAVFSNQACAPCATPAIRSEGSRANSEELQWLEDDADDIFRTIDDGGLF
ncbi:uncharacterized protein ISCGN_018253 [Ixodes scapularis]